MRIGPGTRILLTGASRGIGRVLAAELAGRGATLGLAARGEEALRALAAELPGEHHVLPCDVGDRASVERAVAGFIEQAGGLEVVIANAGIAHYGPFAHVGVDAVEQMTRVNWLGTVYTVGAALPHLLERAEGHVVVISSGAALRAFPWAAGYGGTKAAQRGWADALRHELSGSGVSVTTVFPGEYATDLHAHEQEMMPDWYRGGRDAAPLARAVADAVEADRRYVYQPPVIRLLGLMHGISPRAADAVLRRLRGGTAAPRR